MMPGMIFNCDDPKAGYVAIAYFRRRLAESGYHAQMIEQLLDTEIMLGMDSAQLMDRAHQYAMSKRVETGIERMAREQWLEENTKAS